MTASASAPWFKSDKPFRLAMAAGVSAPFATAVVVMAVGAILQGDAISMVEDPQQDSVFVDAGLLGAFVNLMGLALVGGVFGGIVGWPVTLLIVLPLHGLLLRRTSAGVVWYICTGVFLGLLAALAYAAIIGAFTDFIPIAGAATGLLAGATFWLIRRPDRDRAPSPAAASS